ncbi:MAG: SPOR domain-containing protein [Tannerellaceae bacterium]|nr:SPOR domain-containing protein [Tannerellaceae bacterium]
MKRSFYMIGLCMALAGVSDVAAQIIPYTPPSRYTICDELQTAKPGKGRVIVDQPIVIRNMIGARRQGADIETAADGRSFLKYQGYRVQVFSGNDQRTSKDEAFKREKEMKDLIPGIPTYVTYNAPFWRLRIGDYGSHEEAFYIQRQLMQAFPRYGKEMYIIREEVRLPLDETF